MAYIGNQPGTGVRSRFIFTATASQTTFTGADDNGKTLSYADSTYVDVFLNGVCLVPGTDYTASTKTSIVLTQAASLNDTLEVIAYDIASMSDMSASNGGTFQADVTFAAGADLITATAGTDNLRLGENAGASIASGGQRNTFVGSNSGDATTTGDFNSALGNNSLGANVTGTHNTAIGDFSLALNTGNENTAVGQGSLEANTSGASNTAIGKGSLASNTTSDNSTALGFEAGYNSTGAQNTYLGRKAGRGVTSGTENTFVGNSAGRDGTATGDYNIGIGSVTLNALTSGSNNVAIGRDALGANTTASSNVAVGYQSFTANTTGTRNVGVGLNAGNDNTTGGFNTFAGAYAGEYCTTGNYNTAIGDASGSTLTTGDSNTFIGQQAGNAMTTGEKNTIIGRYTGNSGGLDIRTSNKNIVLADGDANIRQAIDSDGRVSFNTATPLGTGVLQVNLGGTNKAVGIRMRPEDNGNWLLAFESTGGSTIIGQIVANASSTSYNTSSDYRLKTDAQPMTGATDRLKQLNPVNFKWIADNTRADGFLAHEAQAVVPDAVTGAKDAVDEDGNIEPQGIDQSKLVPLLVKTIQELEARITALENA